MNFRVCWSFRACRRRGHFVTKVSKHLNKKKRKQSELKAHFEHFKTNKQNGSYTSIAFHIHFAASCNVLRQSVAVNSAYRAVNRALKRTATADLSRSRRAARGRTGLVRDSAGGLTIARVGNGLSIRAAGAGQRAVKVGDHL